MKRFMEDLDDFAMRIISTPKKEMIPLTNEEKSQYNLSKYCHICDTDFCTDKKDKNYLKKRKVRDHDHYTGKFRGAAHSICNLRYSTTKEIPVISHNGTNYDHHFIINELANKFKAKSFKCLGENMEKYITIEVPILKENVDGEIVTSKLKFIDSNRLISAKFSDHTDNLSEIYKCKCEDSNTQRIHIKRKNNDLISKCKR